MAEYIVQDTSLTPIADEIRALSGVSDKLSLSAMAKNTKDANSEVDTQTDLLAQVLEALSGKAGGGLPDGISEINTGSFILSSAPGSYYRIKHGLSRRPNLWVLYAECEDIATLPDCTLYAACGFYMAHSKDDYGGVFYLGVRYDELYGSDYSFSNDDSTNDTQICILNYSNQLLSVGVNYRWIAAVADGMK